MADIDPNERGISWKQYMEQWWKEMRKETAAFRAKQLNPAPAVPVKPNGQQRLGDAA
jgi:hypothetical protein